MTKNKLVMVLVALCLLVAMLITTGGAAAGASAGPVKVPIIALASPGGSISPAGIVLVNSGSSKTFNIKPASGFHIVDVLVNGASVGRVLKYTFPSVTSLQRIHALFATNLVINAGAGAGGSIDPDGLVVAQYSKNAEFTITPDPGFYIAGLIVDGKRIIPVEKFTFKSVKTAHSILALFNSTYPILASATEGGSISNEGVIMVNAGADQTYQIVPDSGKHIVNVRVDEQWVGVVDNYTFPAVNAPHDIMAVFANVQYPVLAQVVGKGGTISPAGTMMIAVHNNQDYIITPNAGYYILEVKLDGTPIVLNTTDLTAAYTYTLSDVQAPHIIAVTFKKGIPPG
jgi:hypothetical protein